MDLTLYQVITIGLACLSGANLFFLALAKTFWSLTFTAKKNDDELKFSKVEKRVSTLESNKGESEKQVLLLNNTLDNLSENFSKLEKNFTKFSESRQNYHDHIEKISANLMTQSQMMEFLNKMDNLKK